MCVCVRACVRVYVAIVSRCCEQLQLQKNMQLDVEIQFRMNRLIFSQMHYAIDQLDCIELLFPDQNKIVSSTPQHSAAQLPQSVNYCLHRSVLLCLCVRDLVGGPVDRLVAVCTRLSGRSSRQNSGCVYKSWWEVQ